MSKNIKSSPLKILGLGRMGQRFPNMLPGAISALGAYDWGGKRQEEIDKGQLEYDEMKRRYTGLDTSNLYADVSNPYANMQNTMEDLTVNQQQAQFEAQQGQQQRANIMSNMAGAAGSSGVAGLAQAMANQGQLATQRASASIGQQEAANQRAAAQQAGQLQQMERQGAWKADMTRLGGAEQARGLEAGKVGTMFTMATGRLARAKTAQERAMERMFGGLAGMFMPPKPEKK